MYTELEVLIYCLMSAYLAFSNSSTLLYVQSQASSELRHFRRRPRERISSFARRLLNRPELPETQLYRDPPDSFLDPDLEVALTTVLLSLSLEAPIVCIYMCIQM